MAYYITITNNYPIEYYKYKIQQFAKARLVNYTLTQNDLKLNNYLTTKINKNLYSIVKQLINSINVYNTYNGELIIKFKSKELEKVARLITFGNEEVSGSKILDYVFFKRK